MRVCHSATRPSAGHDPSTAPVTADDRLTADTITGLRRGRGGRVGVLQRFERRLGGLVEGAFAKVFGVSSQPVEVAARAAARGRRPEGHRRPGPHPRPQRRTSSSSGASDHDRPEPVRHRAAPRARRDGPRARRRAGLVLRRPGRRAPGRGRRPRHRACSASGGRAPGVAPPTAAGAGGPLPGHPRPRDPPLPACSAPATAGPSRVALPRCARRPVTRLRPHVAEADVGLRLTPGSPACTPRCA